MFLEHAVSSVLCVMLMLCVVGKRYNLIDVSAALCMSLGLIWFTLADSKVAPNFNVTGNSFRIQQKYIYLSLYNHYISLSRALVSMWC